MNDTNIMERKWSYSNALMVEHIETLLRVLHKEKSVTIGSGKSKRVETKRKYAPDPEVEQRLQRSLEYYKRKLDTNVELRDYQQEILEKGLKVLSKHRFLYLAMEVRTGKTLTSLSIADEIVGIKNVLFITKKKAISSIEDDYKSLNPSYTITVVNYESLHLVADSQKWDMVICDEAHSMGAFPKPSNRAEAVAEIISKHRPYVILLSGTPTPESYSQMYHQVYGIPNNPFAEFKNFYRFCDKFVDVKQKKINGMLMNDYSRGKETILDEMRPYTITYTQQEAGFNAEIIEEVLEVEMKESTYKLIDRLKKDLVIEGKTELILADTPVKLMMKVHQLCSGTIKFESGNSMTIDTSKAEFIRSHFGNKKIGIFYKFKEELEVLKEVFKDSLTTDLSVFEDTDKNIALQIVSGREGISLRQADCLVYYNIDFSATSYWQSRDRMTTKDRLHNHIYWVFSKNGIEKDIYKAVTKKKDFTVTHFKKTLLTL